MTGRLALVTGGTGFVGSHVVDEMLAAGYRVRVPVRRTSDPSWLEGKEVERIEVDLASGHLDELVDGVDVTLHVAGLTRGPESALRAVNVEATRRLVEVLRDRPGHRFVLCSSQAAAGPGALSRPRTARDEPAPSTGYGRSKLAAEHVVAGEPDLRWTVVRATAVYGPRDRDTLPFFRMARRGVVVVPGVRRREVQMVHASDLAAALRLSAETDRAIGKTYFVGHPERVAWARVAAAMGRAVDRRVMTIPAPSLAIRAFGAVVGPLAGDRAGQLDARRARDLVERAWTCDVEPALRELEWRPVHDMADGFRDTARWYRTRGWI